MAARPAAAPPGSGGDIPQHFTPVLGSYDYDRRDVMIPMRDGVSLHAVLIVPHAVHHGPIMLDRTPYSAKEMTGRLETPHVSELTRGLYRDLVENGYILAFEDVRGKYGSGGDYVMNRPVVGPLNHDQGRPHHRRLRHHRLARAPRAGIQRPRRHRRHLL